MSGPTPIGIEETRHAVLRRKTDPPRGILATAAAQNQHYHHERYHPSPDLGDYVEHYWVVEWNVPSPTRVETLPHPACT